MAGLWSWISLRFAVIGDLPGSVPADGFHTVFAVDLCLLVPSLVLSGLLLWRRVPAGYALAAAVSVFGAVYQLNLMSAGSSSPLPTCPTPQAFGSRRRADRAFRRISRRVDEASGNQYATPVGTLLDP